jgi:hypothetical protein
LLPSLQEQNVQQEVEADVQESAALAASSNGNLTTLSEPSDKVQVQFVVPEYVTHWGQKLKLVGSVEELGSWKPEKVGGQGIACL